MLKKTELAFQSDSKFVISTSIHQSSYFQNMEEFIFINCSKTFK